MKRKIKQLFESQFVTEGAGVRLRRGFGYPEAPLFDPFLLLDDFGSSNPEDYMKGFPWHPHRGIETVTYMLEGSVSHQDSMGNKGVISSGDVQWMTAGSGIVHQEMPQRFDGRSRGFQLWVNLPKKHKMTKPKYRGFESGEIPIVDFDHGSVKIITGTYADVRGAVTGLMVDAFYLDVTLSSEKTFSYKVPPNFNVFLYIFEGSLRVAGGEEVKDSFVVLTENGDTVEVSAGTEDARFLLIGGEPIGEKIAWHGPIVMNTNEELQTAFEEYQNGTFIK